MSDAIVITGVLDIAAAEQVAATLSEYKVFYCDPALVDKLAESSLQNAVLVRWDNCFPISEPERWAHAAASAWEDVLDDAVKSVAPELSIKAWQHLSFKYLLISVRWYSVLWEQVLQEFAGSTLHILVCDCPSQFYHPSFVPALLLMQILLRNGMEFKAYNYAANMDDPGMVPDFSALPLRSAPHDILVHTPTCFYDHPYFNGELTASGKSVISIVAKNWDTPVAASATVQLTRVESLDGPTLEPFRGKLEDCVQAISGKLDALLAPYLVSEHYRSRQCRQISSTYRSQLLTYFMMDEYFDRQGRPSRVLLSDHDAGFHGPIVSFARKHGIKVLFVPHSKTTADMEFDCDNAICLTHPIQGESITDGKGRRALNINLAYPEELTASTSFPEPLKSVGLLLTGISLNGIYSGRYALYLDGIRQIVDWCRKNGIQVGVRCRPGFSLIHQLSQVTGIDQGEFRHWLAVPMAEFAGAHDLCLMYGSPTTAALEFLRRSIPVLNPTPEALPKVEARIASDRIIPRESVAAVLGTLDSFVLDTTELFQFRTNQFKSYVESFCAARPLRDFL